MKKYIAILTITAFCLSLAGCATVNGGQRALSKSETQKLEKEKNYTFIKGIAAFSGLVIGGFVGIFTASDSQKTGSMIKGCAVGAFAGFAAGYVVTENMKNAGPRPENSHTDEYFKEYQLIKDTEKE